MAATQPRAGGLEIRSIDYVPLSERHGKVWHLGPLWFMSNAQIATLAVGLISISEGAAAKALDGADISFFIGLPVAGILYYLFSRSVDVAAETRVAEAEAAALEEAL
jgi:purine-cytosine permease-like protein